MITFVPMEEIHEMEKWEGADLNKAKVRLAYEVTKLVHGEAEAEKAKATAEGIFGGAGGGEMPTTELAIADVADETQLLDLMVTAKLGGKSVAVASADKELERAKLLSTQIV